MFQKEFDRSWPIWMDTLAACGMSYVREAGEGILLKDDRTFRGRSLFHCLHLFLETNHEAIASRRAV